MATWCWFQITTGKRNLVPVPVFVSFLDPHSNVDVEVSDDTKLCSGFADPWVFLASLIWISIRNFLARFRIRIWIRILFRFQVLFAKKR
jgi:hypothetical protein